MLCPQCGGTDSKIIAPGYFECTTLRDRTVTNMVPDLVQPGVLRPHVHSYRIPCGAKYQEVTGTQSAATCSCGVFAIGQCKRCQRPVCGVHSGLVGDELLCDKCASATRAQASREAWERTAAARAESIERGKELLRAFLAAAERLNWPGSEPIHSGRATHGLSRGQRIEEVRKARSRAISGWAWKEPQTFTEKRRERKTRPRENKTPIVGQGWRTKSTGRVGFDSGDSNNAGSDRFGPVVLLTDGRQLLCDTDADGSLVQITGNDQSWELPPEHLAEVVQSLGKRFSIPLK